MLGLGLQINLQICGFYEGLSSTTWINHLQLFCLKLPSPLLLMQSGPSWSKEDWHCLVKTRVAIWFENYLRRLSIGNSKMKYLNVQISGLTGASHPALHNISTTQDAKKLRFHLKFLTCDFQGGTKRPAVAATLPGNFTDKTLLAGNLT